MCPQREPLPLVYTASLHKECVTAPHLPGSLRECETNRMKAFLKSQSTTQTRLLRWLSSEESPASAGDTGPIPGSGKLPGEGNVNPLQYSHLGNPMDREAWWATVYGVTNSWTRLCYWAHTESLKDSILHTSLEFWKRVCPFLQVKQSNSVIIPDPLEM